MQVLAPDLFLKDYLKGGKRSDGRVIDEKRKCYCTCGCFDKCFGSSMVIIGKTIVATKIEAVPQPIAPSINIEVRNSVVSSPMIQKSVNPTLSSYVQSLAKNFIDLNEFEIVRPDPHNAFHSSVKLWGWRVIVKQNILSEDGSIEIALIQGLQYAISNLVLPIYSLDDEAKLVLHDETRTVSSVPVKACQFALIDGVLYIDPSKDELQIADGMCTIVTTAEERPSILALSSNGAFIMNEETLIRMTQYCQSE